LVTVGGSEAIDLALRACIEQGDEVLIPDPAYVSYSPLVMMSDGTPVHVECHEEDNFVIKPEYLEKAITEKTKAIILTYPNNPTGAIMTEEQLKKFSEFKEKQWEPILGRILILSAFFIRFFTFMLFDLCRMTFHTTQGT
jgi:aminotransferase